VKTFIQYNISIPCHVPTTVTRCTTKLDKASSKLRTVQFVFLRNGVGYTGSYSAGRLVMRLLRFMRNPNEYGGK